MFDDRGRANPALPLRFGQIEYRSIDQLADELTAAWAIVERRLGDGGGDIEGARQEISVYKKERARRAQAEDESAELR